ncbi:MAG TPA: RES family NAD+ phosphorylase [Aquaticitalea sp.]|nr:RES family NAD+ phosphorylase [Aquaticitalea sp.]
MMRVFRLSKRKYSGELNGKGAAKSSNRWNSKGTEIIYTAESRALAMAEVAVHLSLATLPTDYVMMEIEISKTIKIKTVDSTTLNRSWNSNPPTTETQKIGDVFIESGKTAVLKVPSAVVKGDFNYLIHPHHSDFKKIKIISISDFPFDNRLFS